MPLTNQQDAFLSHPPHLSARVLAGPGTGKSFTSVAYLQKVTNENPELHVSYITFTRAATAEFAKKIDERELAVMPRTMHGFALGILLAHRSSSIPYPLRILDSWEVKNIVRPDITAMLRSRGFQSITPTKVAELEREMSAGFQSLDQASLPLAASHPQLVNAYKGIWRTHRSQYGYTLLSELPYHAGQVLEDIDESDISLDLLIVDEYQDLNQADQRVLTNLAERGVSVISIGDDDQSIYSWRNAAPAGIRDFLATFGCSHDYPLTVSMRCGGSALEVASNLIELDSGRPRKPRLSPSATAQDTNFYYLSFRNNAQEAKGVARIIAARIAAGVSPSDIAILVRSSPSAWLHGLKSEFENLSIPMGETQNVDTILGSRSVRKAIAMSQLILNSQDSIAWRALIKITPGLGHSFVTQILNSSSEGSFADKLGNAYIEGLTGRGATIASTLLDEVTQWIRETSIEDVELTENGWGDWLIEQLGETEFSEDEQALLRAVGRQIGKSEPLTRFIAEIEPVAREIISNAIEGVRIVNIAQSKGLTFNTAIIMGVEDGNIPSPRSNDENEELRLLYVAFTRATHLTVATYSKRRYGLTARLGSQNVGAQREQSPFMRDLSDVNHEDGNDFMR